MSKYKYVSYLFVVLGLLVIIGAAYIIIQYASGLISAVVDFVTTNDYSKLQQCGVTPPNEFGKLKNEFATLVLPALYIGLPGILIIVSALMFLAGFYYHKGRLEDEARKHEELERDMVHKIVKKMETEKAPPAPRTSYSPKAPPARQQASDEPEDEPAEEEAPAEEEEPQAEEPEEEQEELPKPKPIVKKRK